MKKGTEHWLETSEYDWDTAHDIMKSGRYVYVVFMCHLSTEKLIKGAIVEFTDIAIPDRIHDLKRLSETAKLELTETQLAFLTSLTDHQAKTRYPADIKEMGQDVYQRIRAKDFGSNEGVPRMVASKSQIQKIVNEFVRVLEPDIKVERVILYGSYARGKPNKWSDIDVAVLSPTFAEMPDLTVIEELARRRIHCDSRLSPFAYTPEQFDNAPPYLFAAEIRRTGKVIYDARKRKKRAIRRKVGR